MARCEGGGAQAGACKVVSAVNMPESVVFESPLTIVWIDMPTADPLYVADLSVNVVAPAPGVHRRQVVAPLYLS